MRFATLCLILALAALPVRAQQQEEVRDVISSQLRAFGADDFDRAFGFASPGIRDMFGTAETFGRMVRQGYPMVHRPGEVTFLGQEAVGEGLRQRLMIRDADGALHVLDYDMVPGEDGWRIDGVRLLDDAQVGA